MRLLHAARSRQRSSALASDRRAGAHARRVIRQRHREMLRDRWWAFASIVAIGAALCVAAQLLLWDDAAPYVVGAIALATVWACRELLTSVDGLANMRLGILGEEWTTGELRKLRRHGWHFVNHVMLERGDVDHAVLGPGGFFAIDSKYRADWKSEESELDHRAKAVVQQANKLQHRLRVRSPRVAPIVAMWGPRLDGRFASRFEHHGVIFCPGRDLVEHLLSLPAVTEPEVVEAAFGALDEYVARRDVGEARDDGPPVRSIGDQFNDLLIALQASLLTLLILVLAINVRPMGLWSLVAGVAVAGTSMVMRRRFEASVRAQRVTAATLATSVGLCAILGTSLIVAAVQ